MYDTIQPHLWPRYMDKKYLQRTLAFYDNHVITTEHHQRFQIDTWDQLVALLHQRNLLCFVPSLAHFPYLDQLIEHGEVYAREDGNAVSARLKFPNQTTRWIVESTPWGQQVPTLDFLTRLRKTYDHAGVGTVNTPGSMGQGLMRRAWKEAFATDWKLHRHQRPSTACCDDLYANMIGARSDLFALGQKLDMIVELDFRNGYAAAFGKQPTGRPSRFIYGELSESSYETYVAHCDVTIPEPGLQWGCFPVRYLHEGQQPKTEQPTTPGKYTTWLWKEEVELARAEGCSVLVQDGWGWYDMTDEPQLWVALVSYLRETAPDEDVEDLIKLCIVAGIGRHGMKPEKHMLVPRDKKGEGDECVVANNGFAYDFWIHKSLDYHPQELPHWFSHTLMQARLMLYHLGKPFKERELLLATNTDAIYVLPSELDKQYAAKGKGQKTGEVGRRELHPLEGLTPFPAKRHLVTQEKVTRPGIPKKGKKK